jgi:patatin-like phospholipase/acyl hydrolase
MDTEKYKKEFKILAIDGGGIKGLYSSTILEHFEEKFNCLLSDYFDLLCGTSTGGLIALAASLKIPMVKISQFYQEEGPKIFPKQSVLWLPRILGKRVTLRDIKQVLYRGKFSDEPLRKAIENVFGNHKIADSNNYLCIPSYTITEAKPWVFKKDHHELDRDDKAYYVDVALATSAAPTFFPLAEIPYYDHKQFIDGGVWANNPTLSGLIEALRFFVGASKEFNSIKILSISSLSVAGGKPTGLKRHRSFWNWKKDLFETSMTGQSIFSEYFMNQIQKVSEVDIDYFRVPTADIAREQEDHVQLDVATPNALRLIRGKGNDMGEIYKKKTEIASFFLNKKLSNVKDYG